MVESDLSLLVSETNMLDAVYLFRIPWYFRLDPFFGKSLKPTSTAFTDLKPLNSITTPRTRFKRRRYYGYELLRIYKNGASTDFCRNSIKCFKLNALFYGQIHIWRLIRISSHSLHRPSVGSEQMSGINPRSTHALLSSLRAGLRLTHKQHSRNRLLHTSLPVGSTTTPKQTTVKVQSDAKPISATASKRTRKRLEERLDSTAIDSISKNLINDLYTSPSSSKSGVTLADVLALKPANTTVTPDEFNKIKDLVAASFNISQLKGVIRSQGQPANGKKSVLVNQVMLFMNLDIVVPESNEPPLVEDPYQAEKNFESEVVPSNRRELFFILGAEGNSLRQLEKEKNVRLSISIADETYTIRGEKASIQEAKERIQHMVAVTEESWDVSDYKSRDLIMKDASALEDIARRSETFVSVGDNNTLVIAGRTDKNMQEAKRLFDLKAQQSQAKDELLFYYQNDALAPLSMLPVYDSVSMNVDETKNSYFRISENTSHASKPALKIGPIYPVQVTPASIGTIEALGEHTKEALNNPLLPNQSLDISAYVGQVLYPNNNSLMTQVPISTSFDSLELKHWIKSAQEPYFFSSVPFYKAVSKLPLEGPKTKAIEVEYVPTSRALPALAGQGITRITFELDNEGDLCIQEGRKLEKQLLTNIMMFDQPLDLQIRSEVTTKLSPDSKSMKALLAQSTLPFANRLDCPAFYSFDNNSNHLSSTPAVAQVGLWATAPTHTLKSVLMKTTGVFQVFGLPLVASEITDQFGQVRRQELKLLLKPLQSLTNESTESSDPFSPSDWRHFMQSAIHLQRLF
ncbi:hypothetical protein FBU30_007687 [Linnemannia zychae]|nr:hypothetical protein FBU30_007687 [Linnemannia zychae]